MILKTAPPAKTARQRKIIDDGLRALRRTMTNSVGARNRGNPDLDGASIERAFGGLASRPENDMGKYNKQVATALYQELQQRLERIPDTIASAPDEGPVIDIISEALGAAISALKSGPQREG